MQDIMERILYDWNELDNVQEIEIIKKYANVGRFISLVSTCKQYLSWIILLHSRFDYFDLDLNHSITVVIYIMIFCFILIQFLSNFLLDITSSKNESRLRQFPVLIELFVDQQKYFFQILLALCFIALCSFTTVVATETLTLLYIQHGCSLFKIAK